jgi:hypothetical protein
MADRLLAATASAYLSPQTVVNRLKSEFSYVETDGEVGRRYIVETIARLRSDKTLRDVSLQIVEKLDRIKNRTVFVCFGDDAGSDLEQLNTYVIPGMPLVFDYASAAHEKAVRLLLTRCAGVLGYEIVKDRRVSSGSVFRGPEKREIVQERRGLLDRRAGTQERRKSRLE